MSPYILNWLECGYGVGIEGIRCSRLEQNWRNFEFFFVLGELKVV